MERMIEQTPCHLCVTHSPLVTQIFEVAMRLRAIPVDDVRSISRRAAPLSGTGLNLDSLSDEMEVCFKNMDRKGYQAACGRLDAALFSLTEGRPFEAYIPHANKILYQEIITHPDCSGYSFIEEGFTSMAWSTRRNARFTPAKIFRNHLRTWRIRPRYQFKRPMFVHTLSHFRAAYAISGQAFLGMPGRTDVSACVPPLPAGSPPGKTYLILDACYLHAGIRWEDYENALVAAVRGQAVPCGELLVKFHFADAAAAVRFESICRRLADADGPRLCLLGADFPVEKNLTQRDVLLFALTSLGYYAALTGARVGCFAGGIEGVSIPAWIRDGRLPEDFLKVLGLAANGSFTTESSPGVSS
jgi:hypothetical protein